MRKLSIALVLGLSLFSAHALAIPSWLIPSPVTVAIQVGQWMVSADRQEVYQIRVQGVGDSQVDARNQAFSYAVDRAVGSLIVTETEIQNDKLERREIINYNSGYVYDFDVIDQSYHQGRVYVLVDVVVRKSDIAERVFGKSSTEADIAGGKLDQALKSYSKQLDSGDRLVNAVLNDYPFKSFDISVEDSEYFLSATRTPVLRLTVNYQWDNKFLRSLEETVETTSSRIRNSSQHADYILAFRLWHSSKSIKYGVDYNRAQAYRNNLKQVVEISLYDHANQVVLTRCTGALNNAVKADHGVVIDPYFDETYSTEIDLINIDIANLSTYTVKAVRNCNYK